MYEVPWCGTYLGYSVPQKKGFCSSPAGNPATEKTSNSEVSSSIQLNNSHKAQGFGFYDLFCLVSECFAGGAFPQVVVSECSRKDL